MGDLGMDDEAEQTSRVVDDEKFLKSEVASKAVEDVQGGKSEDESKSAVEIQYFCPPNSTTKKDAVLLFFCHMLPFTMIPMIVSIAVVFWSYRRWGWLVLASVAILNSISLIMPHYYSARFRSAIRDPFYGLCARYVPSAGYIVPEKPFPEDRAYIFAFHPHGRMVFSTAVFSQLHPTWRKSILKAGDLFMASASGFFSVPLVRNFISLVGFIPADKESIVEKLRKKQHVAIAVGGVKEVLLGTQDDADLLFLKTRRGFCKIAMTENVGIVPVYAFNENQLFNHDSRLFLKFMQWINSYYKIGVPFMRGAYHLPMPYRKDLLIAVGEPLFAKDGESLTDFHLRYIEQLKALFHKYVHLSADPTHKLIIT